MLISDAYPGCVESIRKMQAKVEVSMREVEQMRAKLDLVRTQLLGTPAGATSTPAPPTSGTVFEVRQSIAAHFQQLHDQLNERQAKVERELDEIVQYKDAALKQQRDECEKLLMARRALAGEVQRELAGKSAEWVVANEKQLLHTLAALTSVPAGILDGCVTDSRLEYQRSVTVISQGDASSSSSSGLSASLVNDLGRIVTSDCQAEDWSLQFSGPLQPQRALGSKLDVTVTPCLPPEGRAAQARSGGVSRLFRASIQSPSGNTVVDLLTNQDGSLALPQVTFVEEGVHVVSVTLRDRHVANSPIQLTVTLEPLPVPTRWNALIDVQNMTVSADSCVATKTGGDAWNASAVSQHPVTRYAVRLNLNGAAYNNCVMVGLILLSSFVPMGSNYNSAQKSYCLYTYDGTLCGNGVSSKAYAGGAIADGSIIECVRDLQKKTISFVVNGVDKGVAFAAVPDEDLHAFANIYSQKISVTIVK